MQTQLRDTYDRDPVPVSVEIRPDGREDGRFEVCDAEAQEHPVYAWGFTSPAAAENWIRRHNSLIPLIRFEVNSNSTHH
jgi:hypothetical protein